MTPDPIYVDVRTGEVTPPEVVEAVARDFRSASAAHEQALAEARRLGEEVSRYREDLVAIVPVEGTIDLGDAVLVMEPPSRPAQRVDRTAADRYREQLLALGLGRESLDFHAPTAAAVRERRAELIANGVPVSELLPEPVPGPPCPRIVVRAEAAA